MSIFQRCRRCKRPSSFASVSCFRFNSSTVRLLVWSMFSFPTGAVVAAFLNRREALGSLVEGFLGFYSCRTCSATAAAGPFGS